MFPLLTISYTENGVEKIAGTDRARPQAAGTGQDAADRAVDVYDSVSRLLGHEHAKVTDIHLTSVKKRGCDGE